MFYRTQRIRVISTVSTNYFYNFYIISNNSDTIQNVSSISPLYLVFGEEEEIIVDVRSILSKSPTCLALPVDFNQSRNSR